MRDKPFKYQTHLSKYTDCPPSACNDYEKSAFRWLHKGENENNFKPVLLINPKRTFGSDIEMCSGYALSLFDSEKGAYEKYKNLVKRKPMLRDIFGTLVAEIKLSKDDGQATQPETDNYGHFNFYEYKNVDLKLKISNFVEIFENNGTFKW